MQGLVPMCSVICDQHCPDIIRCKVFSLISRAGISEEKLAISSSFRYRRVPMLVVESGRPALENALTGIFLIRI